MAYTVVPRSEPTGLAMKLIVKDSLGRTLEYRILHSCWVGFCRKSAFRYSSLLNRLR